jgi:hypothetical protein
MSHILPDSEARLMLYRFDKCIRDSIASRRPELETLRGVRFLIRRTKIELWAWKQASKETHTSGFMLGVFITIAMLIGMIGIYLWH